MQGSEADRDAVAGEHLDQLLAVALEAADAGAEVLLRWFRHQGLEGEQKQANDFVTQADKESEQAILGVIQGHFPDHRILAEESGRSGAEADEGGFEWIIDPLDGTSNFLHGLPVFCISIACRHGQNVVAAVIDDPLKQDRFWARRGGGAFWNGRPMSVTPKPGLDGAFLATGFPFRVKAALDLYMGLFQEIFQQARGVRRCGAAALDLAFTAAGVFDGFFEFGLSPWDVAAGLLLIREAGGVVTDLDGGGNILGSGNVLAGGIGVHRGLRRQIEALDLSESVLQQRTGSGS